MQQNAFYHIFLDLLKDLFDAENQIVQKMPKVIQAASNNTLKEALSQHLEETKNQVQRLKQIFNMLNESPMGKTCQVMQALFAEGQEEMKNYPSPNARDAYLIIACQKIEHYEISSYGSACTIAGHLNNAGLDDRIDFVAIADLLQDTLDEESAADEKLTTVAEGGFFTQGINEAAENRS